MSRIDYRSIGLKVGLEIHQQLDTREKLFCSCPAELGEEEHDEFVRQLRPTRSELGDVDPAALFEWRKGRLYIYQAPLNHSCLVEADEEPPHPINREAVAVAVAVAKALGSAIVDEVHVMRKTVIDGSNTSGFQRTAIVALGGSIRVGSKEVPIETIVIEEDAARKVGEKGRYVVYRLDRLGIPLIEIATAPVIESPGEAREVALAIGTMLRLTGKVKRGLGTIRQDLNVSIRGGAKTEIKGVQRLELIPRVIEYEVLRQLSLLRIRDMLRERGVSREELENVEPVDVSSLLAGSKSRVIKKVLSSGGKVIAVKLPRMKGIIGMEIMPGRRFGTELADYARFWGGVGGIIHSDELPGYGITGDEVEKIYEAVGGDPGVDAFALVADKPSNALRAARAVLERVAAALEGVPEETRAALEDGTTRYLRPRPGSARMYPETDIPPLRIDENILSMAEPLVPEPPEVVAMRLKKEYGLSDQLAWEVIRDERYRLIVSLLEKYRGTLEPSYVAGFFVVVLRGLEGEGVEVWKVDDAILEKILDMVAQGEIAREAAAELVKYLANNPGSTVEEAVEKLGLRRLSREEVERIVDEIVGGLREEILKRGEKAVGLVMGRAMAKLRGRADGRLVSEIVSRKIREILDSDGKG
ncbi:glutamyl-tRNA(Gln) amidotransferase subunit E [Aeropyrum pernix K1]|uniref:Glutamyl-tRNA(Gln) amidotransferase subunit E n=1 Tax=Aeropyrum pernix (strain ATCC 700893 / DSM 11879 / JCM 9820 / NBRC 100138 / K1) TaxID=272557 RepID=GATE_AERPE|nr:Glu-tRNA(Gln) amidotransferase subunit GatE [Aeropyrum pernix]Q9Y9T6.1 RecName: Full=Glutamyl-tRNA(Gln) amidotransferase subunit E; Short=Glu-ADT subunit E [Aeropyrum pernix K1]BAA81214.1 glutamyl-tRNA(Gln) amidotransferase subunit E [Aeropyrum pernix K1]